MERAKQTGKAQSAATRVGISPKKTCAPKTATSPRYTSTTMSQQRWESTRIHTVGPPNRSRSRSASLFFFVSY